MHIQLKQTGFATDGSVHHREDIIVMDDYSREGDTWDFMIPAGGITLSSVDYLVWRFTITKQGPQFEIVWNGYQVVGWQPFPLDNRWHIANLHMQDWDLHLPELGPPGTRLVGRLRWRLTSPQLMALSDVITRLKTIEAIIDGGQVKYELTQLRREIMMTMMGG